MDYATDPTFRGTISTTIDQYTRINLPDSFPPNFLMNLQKDSERQKARLDGHQGLCLGRFQWVAVFPLKN